MDRIRVLWASASPLMRAAFVTGVVMAAGCALFLLFGAERVDMAPVFTQLAPSDAQAIVEELEGRDIPFRLSGDGTAVSVPREEVTRLRMEMASAGLPRGGGIGFELFDNSNLMMTDFTQRVNYRRALQGELARTVAQLPEVSHARVHLALPENSLFTRDRTEPSASVYLKLLPGRAISTKQAQGIVHLVSSSVEGLPSGRVAVLDGNGRLLGPAPDTEGLGVTSQALGIAQQFERRMEKRIVDLLEPLAGHGRVVARVSADLDLSRVEETEEQYDPDNATLRSERKLQENTTQRRDEQRGVAGTPGNLPAQPEGPQPVAGSQSNSERTTTESDYAVPRTVRKVRRPLGEVRRLSIAVLLDTSEEADSLEPERTETEEDDVPAPRGQLPSQEALAKIIEKAVGFDAERGDELEVMFAPFSRPGEFEAGGDPSKVEKTPAWMPIGALLIAAAGLLGITVLLAERKRRRTAQAIEAAAREAQEERERLDGDTPQHKGPLHLKDQVRDLTASNVGATVEVMKQWLKPTPENQGG
ncbi:MAG: flagellar basal-body MS-ring/collar protein FliF [Myxococcota bacterium]